MDREKKILVVKASAGTGKTYRLALEYISRLFLGEEFSEILFMTFTRAATGELKERIFEFLDDLKDGDPGLEESILNLYPEVEITQGKIQEIRKKLLENKDKIRIYTIDSFIGQIFKKAIGPYLNIYGYSTITEKEEIEIYENVFSKMLEGKTFERVRNFLEETADRKVEKYIGIIREITQKRGLFTLIKKKGEGKKDVEELEKELYRLLVDIFDLVDKVGKERGFELPQGLGKAGQFLYEKFGRGLEDSKEILALLGRDWKVYSQGKFFDGRKTTAKAVAYLKEELLEKQERVYLLLKEIVFIKEVLPYELELINLEKNIRGIYDEIKFKEKRLSFSDITNYTQEYLNREELDLIKDGEVTENFYDIIGGRIKTLFLDEAQDTSISQWKVIEPIAKRCETLIIVGDEKQSIYSWRGGEKELFQNFNDILGGEVTTLDTNYRSDQLVLDFINLFFQSISKNYEGYEGKKWEYKAVKCSKKESKGFLGVMADYEIEKAIAQDIEDRFKEKGRYNGIGVVARTKKTLDGIADELKNLDIPFIMSNSLSILNHKCIEEVMKLLNFFNHRDFLSLLGFFRQTLKLGEEELKGLLENRVVVEEFLYSESFLIEKELRERLGDPVAKELELVKELMEGEYSILGRSIITKYNFIEKYPTNIDIKNIDYFIQLMEGEESLDKLMILLREKGSDLKQLGIGEMNSVILMTIHRSKGLDFFTQYMVVEDKEESYSIHGREDGLVSEKISFFGKMDSNYENLEDYLFTNSKYKDIISGMDIYKYQEEIFRDESINKLYVGLTRPRANLILGIKPTKTTRKKETVYLLKNELLINPIKEFFEITDEDLIDGGFHSKGTLVENEKEVEEEDDTIENLRLDYDLYKSYLDGKDKKEEDMVEFESKDIKNTLSVKFGLAFHYCLENIEYGQPEEIALAKKLTINKYSNMLGELETERLLGSIDYFIEKYRYIFNSKYKVYRELELYYLDEKTGKKNRRIIDRLNIDEEGKKIYIYDYKSGKTMNRQQLVDYKNAIIQKVGEAYEIEVEFLKINVSCKMKCPT